MKFQYSEYLVGDNLKIFRPTVPIFFKNKSKFIHTEAVIDSGADFTILPIELAGILDIKLDTNSKATFYGAGRNPFSVYPSPGSISCMLRKNGFKTITWKTKVFFAESQPAILLGHKGFLEKFRVTLDGERREVEIMV